MSLAEQLAALTTAQPGFQDPEQDNDVTAAKVTEFEAETDIADTDYLSVETDHSKLRLQNARLDGDDTRYAGKKISRKKLAKLQGMEEEEDNEDGEDLREHAAAELGYMFDGMEEDDDDSEGEDGDEGDNHEDSEGEEGERDNEIDSEGEKVEEDSGEEIEDEGNSVEGEESKDDDASEGEEEVGDASEGEEEVGDASEVEEVGDASEGEEEVGDASEGEEEEVGDDGANHSQGFVFDTSDQDFSKYGEMEEESGSDEEDVEDKVDAEEKDASDDDNESKGADDDNKADILSNRSDISGEVGKGKAVTHQLKTWDKLLETRIQEQKILANVNKLPVENYWSKLVDASESDLTAVMKETQSSLKALLNDLHYLETILDKGSDCERPAKKRKLDDFSSVLEDSHACYKDERNEIILKWNDKTKLLAGKNSFASMETSTVSQIDQILANPSRLIERTRLKRTNFTALGRENKLDETLAEADSNIFDDNDFYHQLLRDLIDRKTNASADGAQMTRQWLEVQKLRSKLKKKVDTKASKGRKIRYDIHSRMVNFMAPVYTNSDRDESTNHLFSSLFGSRKA